MDNKTQANNIQALVIWRIADGKRGHERQTQGLAQAFAALTPTQVVDVPRLKMLRALTGLVVKPRWLRNLPKPDLIIGAGHGTHLTMLALQRACGGKTVVLMRPSLPLSWFDLCLIPQHDDVVAWGNVLVTQGAINPVLPTGQHQAEQGLILIGGQSAHYVWDNAAIMQQVRTIITQAPNTQWRLTTSPRTSPEMITQLKQLSLPNAQLYMFEDTDEHWLPQQMQQVGQIWVSPDSVSMVYEAITSGAAVGVLDLAQQPQSRIAQGIERLSDDGWVTTYSQWQQGKVLQAKGEPFNEAQRCAKWIKDAWFPGR